MRRPAGALAALAVVVACSGDAAEPAPPATEALTTTMATATSSTTTVPVVDGYRLAWSDDFDGPAGSPPDAAAWNHETGGEGWGNRELQYYTDRPENAALDGRGNLAITARAEGAPGGERCWYGPCEYTSARLTTEGKVEPEYGKVEARIKIPAGQGIWSAFWMLGDNIRVRPWPVSGEIDIMENVGHEPNTVHGSAHGPGYSGGAPLGGSMSLAPGRLSDDFHVYSVEWQPDSITWRVDGRLYATATPGDVPGGAAPHGAGPVAWGWGPRGGTAMSREAKSHIDGYWVFDHPFFLILNVAVGGNWPGSPDETTVFPQTMLVDWVRVWARPGSG